MVGYYIFKSAEMLYLMYGFFEHIPDTDITVSVSYTVDKYHTQELYVNVSWVELRETLAGLFGTIDGEMSIVVIAGALASFYFPPMEGVE